MYEPGVVMRQFIVGAAVCLFAGIADAQVNTMPGQVVGTTVNFNTNRVGQQLPRVGAPVGQPLNIPADSPLIRRYDPNRPFDVFKGTNISPNQVVAPIVGVGDQSAFEKLYDKLKSIVGLNKQTDLRAPFYTPGIGRRNRERAEQRMWRRD
jgi:hypothetical protein